MKAPELSSADRALGRALAGGDRRVECLVALTSQALREGHVCLRVASPDIARAVEQMLAEPLEEADLLAALRGHAAVQGLASDASPASTGRGSAEDGSAAQPVTDGLFQRPRSARPLVLDASGRLYLARYYEHEQRLAGAVARLLRLRGPSEVAVPPRWTAGLDEDQARALVRALGGGLTIVSGGPGTGKTSTVVRILAALIERARAEQGRVPKVMLLAPTGKAAVRLSSSILAAKQRLEAPPEVVQALPDQGSTIHRALGVLPRSRTRFRHGLGNPLDADVVVVDEASMVDLALMRHLVEALPASASLLLLGDRDQLSSVDAGNVLAELCDALEVGPTSARDALSQLTRSHRFDAGALTDLASAARTGDVAGLRRSLAAGGDSVSVRPADDDDAVVLELAVRAFRSILDASDVATALGRLAKFRVLCAHRNGPFGVERQNLAILQALVRARLVPANTEYFHGRPVLVTETDPVLDLMNGDVGIVWHTPGAAPSVFFERAGRAPLSVWPAHLPGHETAFAMTIHKSQGSEFDHVAVVLPPADSPLATRELLYTAITRARRRVTLIGEPVALEVGLCRQVARTSGLAESILTHLGFAEAGT